jgi:uncharacterized damage-inducible protein DinB
MPHLISDITHEFHRHKSLADRAVAGLSDERFAQRPAEHVNPIALVVKHLAGNLASRWSQFLTSDGDKPNRDRDSEFVLAPSDTRESLLAAWEIGWSTLFATLATLTDDDLDKTVTIRGEPHRVQQAILRGLDHVAYHTGQILFIARLLNPEGTYLTIPPGGSRQHVAGYLQPPAH